MPRLDVAKAAILLLEIDVHPQHRQKGAGTRLTEKLKEIARAEGVRDIWLATNRSNTAAMALYKSARATARHDDNVILEYHL